MPGHVQTYETIKALQYPRVDNILNAKVLMFYKVVFIFCVTQWCKSELETTGSLVREGRWSCRGMSTNQTVYANTVNNQRVHDVCAPFKPFNYTWFCFNRHNVKL